MLFLTNKGLYVNINQIKTIEPYPEEDVYIVTTADGEELIFSPKSARRLIKIMGEK